MDKTEKLAAWYISIFPHSGQPLLQVGEQLVVADVNDNVLDLHHGKCFSARVVRSRASVAAPPPDVAIFTDDELEYLYLQTDADADLDLFRAIEKKIRRQIARYREFDKRESMNRLVFSEEESNATAAAPTNVACPKCGGTKPTCCSCPSPVAATVDAETFAKQVVGTVFDNTAASPETLKTTMIERIADAVRATPSLSSEAIREVAVEIGASDDTTK